MERATRIELAFSAWEADVLPLNYARGTGARLAERFGRNPASKDSPAHEQPTRILFSVRLNRLAVGILTVARISSGNDAA